MRNMTPRIYGNLTELLQSTPPINTEAIANDAVTGPLQYTENKWSGFLGYFTDISIQTINTSNLAPNAAHVFINGDLQSWSGSGWVSASAGYTLPAATKTTRGGVVIGAGLSLTSDTVSVSTVASTSIFVDSNRQDTYTANGTIAYPYKTLASALSTVSGPTQIVMAPGSYTESIANYPAYPLTVYGNGSTLTLGVATQLTLDYTGYDLNVIAPAGITYAGVAATTRFILRNGSRRGPMTLTSGLLDTLGCTQTWATTSDKMTVSGTGQLLEVLCINTLPILQNSSTSTAIIEECMWNTARANTDLIESSAGQITILNTSVTNTSVTAGGCVYVHNAQTTSLPNVIGNVMAVGVNAIRAVTGVTLWTKNSTVGNIDMTSAIGVPDLKMWTAEPFLPVSAGFTISAATSDDLVITTASAINLGTVYLAKKISLVSTVNYTIVVPTGVTMTYNGIPYTAVTKTVPVGYGMCLWQISATSWVLTGAATLS